MDYKKDIQRHGLVSSKASSGIEAFGIMLSKKCERLATAVYLVTNFLSDTEPLKSRLRALSVDFVRDASFVRYGGQTTTEANVLEILRANIGETLSLLELAFIAGLVSEMNFTILKREFVSLRDSIDIKKASRESRTDTILGDNFFGTPEHSLNPAPAPKGPTFESADSRLGRRLSAEGRTFMPPHPESSPVPDLAKSPTGQIPNSKFNIPYSTQNPKGHSIGQTNTTMSDRNTKGHTPAHPSLRGTKQSSIPAPIPNSKFDIPHSVSKESRRTRILKLIKDNREVSIKDIVSHFPDISEKTIQRELVSLSDSGVLKRSGERRWSRYALA